MKIATLLNIHDDSDVVLDTIESIKTYMTNDILVITDGAASWKEKPTRKGANILVPKETLVVPTSQLEGFYHGCSKSPFRNMTLGLKVLRETWDADWYCYMEYDCLVASDEFKEDLAKAKDNIWVLGNDYRQANYDLPLVEKAIKMKIKETHILLGCCVFFSRRYIQKLYKRDFFNRFLMLTNCFQDTVPGLDEQGAYDLGEILYPTLAVCLGGKVQQLAACNDHVGWTGNAERYPMRFRPEIVAEFPDASIIHPSKSYDHPIRAYYREKRKRLCKNSSKILNCQVS